MEEYWAHCTSCDWEGRVTAGSEQEAYQALLNLHKKEREDILFFRCDLGPMIDRARPIHPQVG